MSLTKHKNLLASVKKTKDTSWYEKVFIPRLLKHKDKYMAVEKNTGVPAAFVMCLHTREAASDIGGFNRYLGNGQPISKRTTKVPKGRGPFKTWEDGAIDAIRLMNLHHIEDWSVAQMCWQWERYNGLGYQTRGLNSPYVWNFTNHYSKGHYVADGTFSSTSIDNNIGCYVLYKLLVEQDETLDVEYEEPKQPDVKVPNENKGLEAVFSKIFEMLMKIIGMLTLNRPKEPDTVQPEEPVKPKPKPPRGKNYNLESLKVAIEELGVKEIQGEKSNKQVVKYHAYAREDNDLNKGLADSVPWCSSFVCYVLENSGLGSTNSMSARSYLDWGKSSMGKALPGDIAVFWRGSRNGWQGHVGFYVDETESFVYVLGGNQNDSVNITRYSKSKLLDIRRASDQGLMSEPQEDQLWDLADGLVANRKISFGGKVT